MNRCESCVRAIKQMVVSSEGAVIPKEYQQVAWIQGNGAAYIDTGIKPDAQTGMESSGEFNGNDNIQGVNIVILGCRYSLNGTNYSLNATSEGTMRFNYGTRGLTHVVENCTQFSFIPGIDMKFRYQREDGTSGNVTIPVKSFNPALNLNFWLFALNNNGTPSYGTCIVNYFKMYSGTTLTRSFIPCYRKSDSKTGMYDLVTHEFYPVIGTGEFILGPEV